MKLDHRKYTVIAVLAALILLLMAGSVMAQPVITTFQPDKTDAEAGETVTWTAHSPTGESYCFYIMKKGDGADQRVHLQWYSAENSVSYTFPDAGTYYARVFVLDAAEKLTLQDTLEHWDVVVEGGTAVLSGLNFVTEPGLEDPPIVYSVPYNLTYKVEPIGGQADFEYAFYVYRAAAEEGVYGRVHMEWYSSSDTLTYTATEPGFYQVQAFVRDATGKTVVDKSGVVEVKGTSTVLKIKEFEGTEDNGIITWNVEAEGGEGPYQFAFYVYKGENRVHMQWYGEPQEALQASLTYAPTEEGTYELQAFVRDKTGKTVLRRGGPVEFKGDVLAALELLEVKLQEKLDNDGNPIIPVVGDQQTWKALAEGGEKPYQYAFYVYEAGVRVHVQWYGAADSVDFTPTKGEETQYYVQAFVRDEAETTKIKLSETVIFSGDTIEPFGINAVTLTTCDLGDLDGEWTWTVNLPENHDGGDTISYCYYIYKGETRVEIKWYEENQDTCSYLPKEIGSYSVQAFARDENLKTVYKKSDPQETKLYHYYYLFQAGTEDDQSGEPKEGHGFVMASGYPVLKYGNHGDNITNRGYSNHTSSLRSAGNLTTVENGESPYTLQIETSDPHSLKWLADGMTVKIYNASPLTLTDAEFKNITGFATGTVCVAEFVEEASPLTFTLQGKSVIHPIENAIAVEFTYLTGNADRTTYNAQGGTLTLSTLSHKVEEEATTYVGYTWTNAKGEGGEGGEEIRFAGLRPNVPDKPRTGIVEDPLPRVEFWQYMIAPNLPYAEIEFKDITSIVDEGQEGQEARFNFDWLINKPSGPTATGYDPYEQRIGLGVSAGGKLYVMDSKGGKYTADDAHYFDWFDLGQTAVLNEEWNTVRLQVLANGSVQMILNGSVVHTSAPGYYNVADARRGAITLEVLQVAPAETPTEDVGNASVKLQNYSFGITRLLETGPSY